MQQRCVFSNTLFSQHHLSSKILELTRIFFFKCEQLLICSFHCWFIHLFYKKNRQTNPAVGNDRENSNMFDIVLRSDWAPQTMSQICAQSHPNQGPGWLYKVPSVCGHARVHHHVPRPFCGQWEVHEVCPRGISVRYLWVDILDLVLVIFPQAIWAAFWRSC